MKSRLNLEQISRRKSIVCGENKDDKFRFNKGPNRILMGMNYSNGDTIPNVPIFDSSAPWKFAIKRVFKGLSTAFEASMWTGKFDE